MTSYFNTKSPNIFQITYSDKFKMYDFTILNNNKVIYHYHFKNLKDINKITMTYSVQLYDQVTDRKLEIIHINNTIEFKNYNTMLNTNFSYNQLQKNNRRCNRNRLPDHANRRDHNRIV